MLAKSGFQHRAVWVRFACAPGVQDVDEAAERRLPEFTTATQAEKFKEQEKSVPCPSVRCPEDHSNALRVPRVHRILYIFSAWHEVTKAEATLAVCVFCGNMKPPGAGVHVLEGMCMGLELFIAILRDNVVPSMCFCWGLGVVYGCS